VTSNDLVAPGLGDHARPLGICWVIYGLIRLAMAIFLVTFGGTATLMFGALLNRVADPFTLMGVFHFLYAVAVVLSAVCGLLGLSAGLALLGGQRSARTLCLIAGFLSLPNIPLGTTLGIYTLIVCFR
jgi:hypothetical protein